MNVKQLSGQSLWPPTEHSISWSLWHVSSSSSSPDACLCRAAAGRLGGLDTELKQLKKQQKTLNSQWEGERQDMLRLQSTKEEIDRVNLEVQAAERDYDLNRAAELKYGTLLELQKALAKAEQALAAKVGHHELAQLSSCVSLQCRPASDVCLLPAERACPLQELSFLCEYCMPHGVPS